jgi:hypothetical protein
MPRKQVSLRYTYVQVYTELPDLRSMFDDIREENLKIVPAGFGISVSM